MSIDLIDPFTTAIIAMIEARAHCLGRHATTLQVGTLMQGASGMIRGKAWAG